MKTIFPLLTVSIAVLLLVQAANADCSTCAGDVGIKKIDAEFWGESPPSQYSKHVHDFGARCNAADLANYTGEVGIMIAVSADLEGGAKYVTANFVSGTVTTPITSSNGFIGAPSDGKFFKDDGITACGGELQKAVVNLDFDDFNALLAAGNGTMKIEVIASDAVEDVCELCCDTGHSWTPDDCCDDVTPCACPPGVASKTEVTLVYLDCKIMADPDCDDDEDCLDPYACNGQEQCVDGECVPGTNPCSGNTPICEEFDPCPPDCYFCGPCMEDAVCEILDGIFCNGISTCNEATGACVAPAEAACDNNPSICFEEIRACLECECCIDDADCADEEIEDGLFCNGIAECDGCACIQPGYPCGVLTCDEASNTCN